MSKLSQLQHIRRLGLPTPDFVGISYQDIASERYKVLTARLKFPVAVRSSFSLEDGKQKSYAGHFLTKLAVLEGDLREALEEVFDSYPYQHGQSVIVQEMIKPDASGVLFAYRQGIWKVEYAEGRGDALVSGQVEPNTLILPKFLRRDIFWSAIYPIWKAFPKKHPHRKFLRPFVKLASYSKRLSDENPLSAPIGIDIEFAISGRRTYILQARPLTTPDEAEELLTSANHKEILPPEPSRMMTAIISASSKNLFSYYQRLDPSLTERNFIEISAGMPWINLSALLDTMTAWGLPSSLVCESVGAEDVYNVKIRPYQMLRKWPVFLKVIREQLSVVGRTRRWVRNKQRYLLQITEKRRLMWRNQPDLAFNNWKTDLQVVYVELVALMQALTGAMSGPMKLFARWGVLPFYTNKSESTEFLHAFSSLRSGRITKEEFLKNYGHRGFYESDIGQKRFKEFEEKDWNVLLSGELVDQRDFEQEKQGLSPFFAWLTRPFLRIMIAREWLRHHSMRYFGMLRDEIMDQTQIRFGQEFDFSNYQPEDLQALLERRIEESTIANIHYPAVSGWDMDTFLWNKHDRRLPLSVLTNHQSQEEETPIGMGIFPGLVRGQIWKVDRADLGNLSIPSFKHKILLTESLDPGWIPYFVQVDAVLSHVGGILSHASIILRESRIPSITRVPRQLGLAHGDWVEIDGKTGIVTKISQQSYE
ncbi:MAG: PEP/pyruvate-binding domain-containing protein [Bacteroidota bacterium]